MGWTDEMVKDLKKMWKEGMTTGEIGKKLGVSKNSVVGKVHRLNLDGRPSPIKKKAEQPAKPATKQPIPASKPAAPAPKPAVKPAAPQPAMVKKPEPAPANKPVAKPNFAQEREISAPIIYSSQPKDKDGKTGLTHLDNHTCRWPIGDPKDENFHFCGKKVRMGQTYCDEHSVLAYVRSMKK